MKHGTGLTASLCIFSIVLVTVLISPWRKSTELTASQIDSARKLKSWYDPKTTLSKIPRLVHYTISGELKDHYKRVLDYSFEKLKSYNFDYMIHSDEDLDALIRENYPFLIPTWDRLMEYKNEKQWRDRGARIGDFGRLVALYHYGGVYLDLDMIPCTDLTFMVDEPGVVTFPQVNAKRGQILNSAFSGPPGHMFFWVALQRISYKNDIIQEHILEAAGPAHLTASMMEYHKLTNTRPIMDMFKRENVPEPADGSLWVQSGGIRFGAYYKKGPEYSRGMPTREVLGLSHLHFRSWVRDSTSRKSRCDTELDLMTPFMNHMCKGGKGRDSHWSYCGDGQKHSGMLDEEYINSLPHL